MVALRLQGLAEVPDPEPDVRADRARCERRGQVMTKKQHLLVVLALGGALAGAFLIGWRGSAADTAARVVSRAPDGWTTAAPRDEIRPEFAYDPSGGPDGKGCFTIKADRRDGLAGCWQKTFAVSGGKHYRFQTGYQASGVAVPRRS